jgi:hypothetical protein
MASRSISASWSAFAWLERTSATRPSFPVPVNTNVLAEHSPRTDWANPCLTCNH